MNQPWLRLVSLAAIVLAVAVTPRIARADVIVVRGVELKVPSDWSQATRGPLTMLAPRRHKGRAIEVASLRAMPAPTAEAMKSLLGGGEQLVVSGVKELEREGVKLVAASGKVTGKRGEVAVDVLAVPLATKAVLLISFVGSDQDPLIRKANMDILLSARVPGPRMAMVVNPSKRGLQGPPPEVLARFQKVIGNLDKRLRLPRPLPVVFDDCGMVNAFYNSGKHSITMCHEMYDDFVALFGKAGLPPAKARSIADGAFMFVFFHELGHALVGELELPITGRGEDAADEIATIVLSANGKQGHQAAMSGAAWFQQLAKTGAGTHPFWSTHSFDAQRLTTITCLLYGADRARYTPLMKQLKVPPARLAKCTRDYPLRRKAWNGMLAPHTVRAK